MKTLQRTIGGMQHSGKFLGNMKRNVLKKIFQTDCILKPMKKAT